MPANLPVIVREPRKVRGLTIRYPMFPTICDVLRCSSFLGAFRMLPRDCRIYGSNPRFVFTSATIANPQQHASTLIGAPLPPRDRSSHVSIPTTSQTPLTPTYGIDHVAVVDHDTSPHGEKLFVLWNPPFSYNRTPPGQGDPSGNGGGRGEDAERRKGAAQKRADRPSNPRGHNEDSTIGTPREVGCYLDKGDARGL